MISIEEFTARYMAVWHEADPGAREAAVAELWSADARVCTGANEYVGHEAITRRVTLAHDQFVAGQGCLFRPAGPGQAHHGGIRLRWEMGPAAGGAAVSGGTQFVLLDPDGRARLDYQFTDF